MNSRVCFVLLMVAVCASCAGTKSVTPAPAVAWSSSLEWVDTPVGRAVRAAPAVLSRVNPTYPDVDRRTNTQGLVRVEAVIDESGKVVHTEVLEAPSATLAESVAAAVRQWTFAPTVLDGKPVRAVTPVSVRLRL